MITILTDADLKRGDLSIVPLDHIELSDFAYFHNPEARAVGESRTIIYLRDGLIKIFKHFLEFPDRVAPASNLPDYIFTHA